MKTIQVQSGELAESLPDASGVRVFKGIPYAAPPVGPLRFAPPHVCPPWPGVRNFRTYGHNSLQKVVFGDIDPMVDGVSEDCLYLNVWSNAGPGEKRAVLFWIHGGGFVVGSGSEPRYDGAKLAARGIVVVTLNHRLNALGYLAHPALTEEAGASGNFAMLDIIAALQWVNRNIAAFGGDASRITIAGESAGSMAVSILMCSPLAKGLFAQAIGQSGGMLATPSEKLMTLPEAEAAGKIFADKLGAKTASELRALPASAILDAAPGLGYRPIIDGIVLPEHPQDIFTNKAHHDVPMIVGWNKDEGFNFDTRKWGEQDLSHWLKLHFGAQAKVAEKFYGTAQASRDLGGDLIINHGTWRWVEAQMMHGKSAIYRYSFDYAPKTQAGFFPADAERPGAFHSCEIPYVFDVPDAMGWQISPDDVAMAKMTADYWVNFIVSGDPNGAGLIPWPAYRQAGRPCLRINTTCTVENDIDGARHRFLAERLLG